jgi:hypothetical protein
MFQILHNIKNKVIIPPPPPTTTTTTTRMHNNKSSVSFDESNVTQTLSSRTPSLPPPSPPPSPTRDGTSPKLPKRVPFGNNGGDKTQQQQQQQQQQQSSSPQKSRSQSQSLHSRDESMISVSSNKTSLTSPKLRSNLMREQKERDPLFFYEVVKTLGVGSMVRTPFGVVKERKRITCLFTYSSCFYPLSLSVYTLDSLI